MSDWQVNVKPFDADTAVLAEAADRLPRDYYAPILSRRDCELARFDLAAVLEAGKHQAP